MTWILLKIKHHLLQSVLNAVTSKVRNECSVKLIGRKDMFYLTTHSTHFIYSYMEGNVLFNDAINTFYLRLYGRKEGNVLFKDALSTFYLWLYGVGHMVTDHSDSERGKPLPPHGLLFLIDSKGSFICTIPQTG